MALISGVVSTQLYEFIQKQNATEIQDKDVAIREFCNKIEELIYQSVRNATLTIPSGMVLVSQPPTVVGAVNPAPIVVINALK